MHMAKPSNIAPIRSKASLQLIAIGISHSFGHRERQTGTRENMAAIDRANERVDEAQDVGCVLCIDRKDTGSQDGQPDDGTQM